MCRGGQTGEEELSWLRLLWGSTRVVHSIPSIAGAPEGWAGLPLALAPLARASVLALGWERAPSPGSAEKGCLEKPRAYFSSVLASAVLQAVEGRH